MTLNSVTRFVVPIDWNERDSWDYALAYANRICESAEDNIRDAVLLVHTKVQIDSTVLADHIGDRTAKALSAGRHAKMLSGAMLRLETERKLNFLPNKTVLIVFFADDRLLELVDGLMNVAGVVVVPSNLNSVEEWKKRWNPKVHGQTAPTEKVDLIEDSTVVNALNSITSMVNLATGIGHNSDKQFADHTFRILRAKGHNLDTNSVKSWAIQNGWKPKDAEKLSQLAEKISRLKNKPSLSKIYNAKERYVRWQESGK